MAKISKCRFYAVFMAGFCFKIILVREWMSLIKLFFKVFGRGLSVKWLVLLHKLAQLGEQVFKIVRAVIVI
jgi:hypothetical protein